MGSGPLQWKDDITPYRRNEQYLCAAKVLSRLCLLGALVVSELKHERMRATLEYDIYERIDCAQIIKREFMNGRGDKGGIGVSQ